MKLKTVLLRWYKSFHLNYRGTLGKNDVSSDHPWNRLVPSYVGEGDFPFIEIPVESDITTIVGANESGKSHLLNAITKVIRGTGLDDADEFERTDLCHYAGVRTRNAEAWPNIGLQFTIETLEEFQKISEIIGNVVATGAVPPSFTLILAPDQAEHSPASLLIEGSDTWAALSTEQLEKLRSLLPRVQFIDSKAQLPSEIALAGLIAAYGDEDFKGRGLLDRRAVEAAAGLIQQLPALKATQQISPEFVQQMEDLKHSVVELSIDAPKAGNLEVHLFREILEITVGTLKHVYGLPVADRGYIEGQISKWNEEIKDRLNLAHFWRQDDEFSLSINYKDGVVYFEIRDKTDSVYTFKERSSGLKFFLSYYIQAKAMELTHRNRNSIVLMDEPDSALSILGQRNLLAVFESLVSLESSAQTCQLVYTTHSPYLINRNFPRRIRVVKKEDAEEGTQYIEQARSRRYEPVRTALGVDSAPSLFLGADNVLLEGATDQYLLTELVRVFATPSNVGNFIDLNIVVTVSADSVNNVPSVLNQSRWADEPIPPTIIIVDADKPALAVVDDITGNGGKKKALIDREFVRTIGELIQPFGENAAIVTSEDIVPAALYRRALTSYFRRVFPDTWKDQHSTLEAEIARSPGNDGIVAFTRKIFLKVKPELNGDFDKMGVLQEVIVITSKELSDDPTNADVSQSRKNVTSVCDFIREALVKSRAVNAKHSATNGVKRIINDFARIYKKDVPITALLILFRRLEREVAPIGNDGEDCLKMLNDTIVKLDKLRAAGQDRIHQDDWAAWQKRIEAIKKNPLGPGMSVVSQSAVPAQGAAASP